MVVLVIYLSIIINLFLILYVVRLESIMILGMVGWIILINFVINNNIY